MAGNSDISEGELRKEDDSEDLFEFGDDLELNQFDGLPYSSRYYRLLQERKSLPVWKHRHQFMTLLENNRIIVISGTTKTGKSTQVPQWCAEFCLSAQYQHGVVVCSQIQKRQAIDLALRVADEMDVNIGHEIGYSIPLESCCSKETFGNTVHYKMLLDTLYCTDETLLQEMMSDPLLNHYGVVVIDQAHERTLSTDLLLALLRAVSAHRPNLRVVVLTAPPAPEALQTLYGTASRLTLEATGSGEVIHSSRERREGTEGFFSALRLVLEVHRSREPGDIALFLASEQEVAYACKILTKEASRMSSSLGEILAIPICSEHTGIWPPITDSPWIRRKVFISCSQSEDLFWAVDSIAFIIDTGVEKRMVYNPRVRASSEVIGPISRCQAEIRKQLTGPADPEALMQAIEELDYLAALDNHGNLSAMGIIMSELPVDPQMAKALLASCEFDCASEMLIIAAMLTAPSCFMDPPVGMNAEVSRCHVRFQHPEGDHFTLINIYNTFKRCQSEPCFNQRRWCEEYFLCCAALQAADAIRAQLSDIIKRLQLPVSEPAFGTKSNALNIKRALLAGYFMQVARDVDCSGNYFILMNKHIAQVHRESVYGAKAQTLGLPEWLLFHQYNLRENCIVTNTHISPQMFLQMAPQYFFCNLPSSESKAILQNMLDSEGTSKASAETKPEVEGPETEERCVLQ
ncbi:hypothetical protein DNTS_004151 [Danionella cerebrum]|uniref:Helicase ATP-binding domain-containing protein n=1 Tax=Danionella cerebrum TaxID=2873325 RepID=A0A553MQP3_9TELE|nr:hypothetical protein DNTS_004151 [Danionella translucida]